MPYPFRHFPPPKQRNGSCGVCARYDCDGECCEPNAVERVVAGLWWLFPLVASIALIVIIGLAIGAR